MHNLTEMDYVRAAIANALYSGVSLEDLLQASLCADNAKDFDEAVNIMGLTVLPIGVGCNYEKGETE